MKQSPLQYISVLTPYIAVVIGLYVFNNAWLTLVLYHLGILAFSMTGPRRGLLEKFKTGWNLPLAAAAAVMSLLVVPILFFLWPFIGNTAASLDTTLSQMGLSGPAWLLFIVYFSTVQPFLEELYWRGFLGSTQRWFSSTDLIFAGYHVLVLARFVDGPWLLLVFLAVAFAGAVWRILASRLNGLAVPLLSHVLADMAIITTVAACRGAGFFMHH